MNPRTTTRLCFPLPSSLRQAVHDSDSNIEKLDGTAIIILLEHEALRYSHLNE